ncbi:TonB-dependent receptor domain-containing protein [Elongatibacter sediminis]|uniref:TonB-dependent receptor n=1 Tax=Elongatibacter sediminis TaxID=3119006 RepID=A0AAW9RHK5_9GAMM
MAPLISLILGAASSGLLLAQEDEQPEEDTALEEVVVTSPATRLTSGFEAPKPTTTVDSLDFEARGTTNIADYLNEVPAFVSSVTPTSSTSEGRGGGTNMLNLRNLGPDRLLMLVDKRRWVSTGISGGVDLNMIPQVLVEQVEVVTGGVSAQWGSDAISGVVNMRLRRNLDGGKLNFQYGETSENDARDKFASFGYGFSFADDRGHVTFGAEYQDNSGIGSQSDRDWGAALWGIVNNPDNTGPNDGIPARIVVPDARLAFGTTGGYLPLQLGNHPSVAQVYFGENGEILPYDIGEYPLPLTTLPFQVGGSGGSLAYHNSLLVALERKSVMGLLDFEITDNVNFFLDGSWAESDTEHVVVQPWNFIKGGPDIIRADNPYIPDQIKQAMVANNVPVLRMGRSNEDLGFITDYSNAESWRVATGLQGDWNGWTWDAYWTHGEWDGNFQTRNNVIKSNYAFATDAVMDPGTGEIVCRANVGGANGAPGCAPLNLFGIGAASQAALDYIHGTQYFDNTYRQDVLSASMSGELFDMPAGPLAVAFGIEYRDEKGSVGVDELAASGQWFIGNTQPISGSFDVHEAFVEVGVPLVETPEGMSLGLTGAVRYADYSSSGSAVPWQLGLSFSPVSDLRFRATVSSDIRAPNISELFAAQVLNFGSVRNPATGEVTLTQILTGGNPNLDEEEADTTTAGIVFQPSFARGLRLSLDWYRTKIDNAISTLSPQGIVDQCFELDIGCENVEIIDGSIASVNSTILNVANRTVEGLDFEADYYFESFLGGDLNLRWLFSHYIENSYSPDGITTFDDVGVVGNASGGIATPDNRWNLTANWQRDQLGLTAQVVYIGGGDLFNDFGPEDINDNSVDSQTMVNLSIRYDIPFRGSNTLQLYAGINNVFDEDPPIAPANFLSNYPTNMSLYSVLGRNYFGGIRLDF